MKGSKRQCRNQTQAGGLVRRGGWLGTIGFAVLMLLGISTGAMAQVETGRRSVAAPAVAQAPRDAGAAADTPSVHGALNRTAAPEEIAQTPAAAPTTQISMTRMLLSLALVVVVILALRWGGVRIFGGAGAIRSSQVMHVVSRSIISPKQQLILVQVGRRLVMVGNSGTHLAPLAEITNADEVAELLGQAQRDKSETISKTFGTWMRKAGVGFAGESVSEAEVETEAEAEAQSRQSAEREEWTAAVRENDVPEEAEVVERPSAELAGLLGKVRGMSRQFRNT